MVTSLGFRSAEPLGGSRCTQIGTFVEGDRPHRGLDAATGDPLNPRGDIEPGSLPRPFDGVVGRQVYADRVGRGLLRQLLVFSPETQPWRRR